MRLIAGLAFLFACGGPPRVDLASGPKVTLPAPPSAPAEPPSEPTGPSAALLARLPIREGRIPDTAYAIETETSVEHCGGVMVTVVAADDLAIVDPIDDDWFFTAVLALEMPDPDDRDALDDWTSHVAFFNYGNAGLPLRSLLRDELTDREELIAHARLVQLYRRFAEVFVRAPIPDDMFEEPDRSAWCDGLADQIVGVVELMEESAAACRAVAAKSKLTGWWDPVCGGAGF